MDIIQTLKSISKFKHITIDNLGFKCHYKYSASLFTVFFITVSVSRLFGDTYSCLGNEYVRPIANDYCWNGNMYIVTNPHMLDVLDLNTQPQTLITLKSYHIIRWLSVYRWLPIILGIHALSLCLTHFMWKVREQNVVSRILCKQMKGNTQIEWNEKKAAIVRKLSLGFGSYKGYAIAFCSLEVTNLIVAVVNIFAIDWYLGTSHYGLSAIGWISTTGLDFQTIIWPETAKCTVQVIGPSGTLVSYDHFCNLNHSYLYREIFKIVWFWLAGLVLATVINLGLRVSTILSARFREFNLSKISPASEKHTIKHLIRKGNFGDYLLLSFVGQSLPSEETQEIFMGLDERLGENNL